YTDFNSEDRIFRSNCEVPVAPGRSMSFCFNFKNASSLNFSSSTSSDNTTPSRISRAPITRNFPSSGYKFTAASSKSFIIILPAHSKSFEIRENSSNAM
ncbi:hypothetical protein CAEBREN_13120, partial [Caenorhabditis brenneri]